MNVEVAIVGPSFGYVMGSPGLLESPDFADQGEQLVWQERLRTTVDADEQTTLAEVVNAAAEVFGIRVILGGISPSGPQSVADVIDGIAFWSEGDDVPGHFPLSYASYFLGLDPNGIVIWGTARDMRIYDLVCAAERHVVSFDPLRIYLHPSLPQGGEIVIAFWDSFQSLWSTAWPIIDGVAASYGAVEFLCAVRRRLGRVPTLTKLRSTLETRGAGPGQVTELLTSRPWTPPEIAPIIPCTPAEAEELLDLAGLTHVSERDRWEKTAAKEAVFSRHVMAQLVNQATLGHGTDKMAENLRRNLEAALLHASEAPGLAGMSAMIFDAPYDQPDVSAAEDSDEMVESDFHGGVTLTEGASYSYRLVLIEGRDLTAANQRLSEFGAEGYQVSRVEPFAARDDDLRLLVIMERIDWTGTPESDGESGGNSGG